MKKINKILLIIVILCTIFSIFNGDSYKYTGFLSVIYLSSAIFRGSMKIVDIIFYLSSVLIVILFVLKLLLNL